MQRAVTAMGRATLAELGDAIEEEEEEEAEEEKERQRRAGETTPTPARRATWWRTARRILLGKVLRSEKRQHTVRLAWLRSYKTGGETRYRLVVGAQT